MAATDVEQVRSELAHIDAYEEEGLAEIVLAPVTGSVAEGLKVLHGIADEFIDSPVDADGTCVAAPGRNK